MPGLYPEREARNSYLDPEIEFHFDASSAGGFGPPDLLGVHRGHEGYLRVLEAVIEAMEDFKLKHEEVIDFGDGCWPLVVRRARQL